MKYLLRMVSFIGDRITCTGGKTVAENLEAFADLTPGQKSSCHLKILNVDGPLIILKGTWLQKGSRQSIRCEVRNITGPAKVFDSEEAAIEAVLSDEIVDGDVVVVRFRGS